MLMQLSWECDTAELSLNAHSMSRENDKLTSIASCASRSKTHPSVLLCDVGSASYIIYREVGRLLANHPMSPFLGACHLE